MSPVEEIEKRILNFNVLEEVIEVEMEDGSVIEIKMNELRDETITKGKLAEVLYETGKA